MAETITELAIKMSVKDQTEAGFNSVSRAVSSLKSQATSQLGGISSVASRLGGALREGISSGAWFALGAVGRMASGMRTAIGNVINTVFSLKTALIGLATGAVIKTAWDWLIDPNVLLENMRMTINTLVGDAEAAAGIIEFLMKEALRPGFEPTEVYKAGQMLVPFAKDEQGRFNREMFEQMIRTAQILKATDPSKTLEDAAYALREALGGDWISLQDRFNIPRSVINRLKEAYGVSAGGAEVTAESVEDLRRKQRDLMWSIEELTLAMQEGERVQLGRVTSVERASAATLRQQHRMIQLQEQLEDVNKELARQEEALANTGDESSEMETNLAIVNDALDEMGYGFNLVDQQADTFQGKISTLKGLLGELFRIVGEPTFDVLNEQLSKVVEWARDNEPMLRTLAETIGERLAEGVQSLADWLASIDWENVASSLKSWGEGFGSIATFLAKALEVVEKWPPWAKGLLIGGLALQATTGIPGVAAGGLASVAMGGLGTVGATPVMITAVAAGVLAAFSHSLKGMTQEEFMREKGYTAGIHAEAMEIAERRREQGVMAEAGYWTAREVEAAGGYEAYRAAQRSQEITVNVDARFAFDGTLSSTEEARLMEEWSAEIDKSFEGVARKVGESYRR